MDELRVMLEAEVLAFRIALALVVEMLPAERQTTIREVLAKFAEGVDQNNALQQAFSVGEAQGHQLQMALRGIIEAIDMVRSAAAA